MAKSIITQDGTIFSIDKIIVGSKNMLKYSVRIGDKHCYFTPCFYKLLINSIA